MNDDVRRVLGVASLEASRLRRAREMAGLSLGQAVKLLGWLDDPGRATLAAIEGGESDPSTALLRDLAEMYGVSSGWIRGVAVAIPERLQSLVDRINNDADRESLLELLEATQGRPV